MSQPQMTPEPANSTLGATNQPDRPDSAHFGRPAATLLLGRAPSSETLARWFEALGRLQRAAATSQEFFDLAASALIQPGGLDQGLVLLQREGSLELAACCSAHDEPRLEFSAEVVQDALARRQTMVYPSVPNDTTSPSEAVMVAPIFGAHHASLGALYAVRTLHRSNLRTSIRTLEAQWVQLVAEAVGAGMQRVAAETQAARTRLMFEQAFTPKLVDELLRNPELLNPHQREVTVMFCDLRDSTSMWQDLSPADMYRLLGEVLEGMTEQVNLTGGVIIDYFGDGLAAMWNAPHDQPDHPRLACETALAIHGLLERLNAKWQAWLDRPLRLGIGIHTDVALVGNAGSSQRLKYGPRGRMVSLASRLEEAAKQANVPTLISGTTYERLATHSIARPVRLPKLRGIMEPVKLFELRGISARHPQELHSSR